VVLVHRLDFIQLLVVKPFGAMTVTTECVKRFRLNLGKLGKMIFSIYFLPLMKKNVFVTTFKANLIV
jgi:hypothetical protein